MLIDLHWLDSLALSESAEKISSFNEAGGGLN
jgi:hypothetical protein